MKENIETWEEFEEQELIKLQQECDKYNYKAMLQFNQLHIHTQFECWYFVPNDCGCIKLMHKNGLGISSSGFHKQFSRKMDYQQLVQYIHEHELAKYKGAAIDFTFSKKGALKGNDA